MIKISIVRDVVKLYKPFDKSCETHRSMTTDPVRCETPHTGRIAGASVSL